LKIEKVKIKSLQYIWKKLYKDNPLLSVYQSFEFQSIAGKGWTDKRPWIGLQLNELNLLLTDNDIPIAIATFVMRKSFSKGCEIYFRGEYSSAAHLDFIYKANWSYEAFAFIIDYLKDQIKLPRFHFNRVPEKSITNEYIRKYFNLKPENYRTSECVTIPIATSYKEYYEKLSRNARKNIRLAYNRLATDGMSYRIVTSYNSPIPNNEYRIMLNMYAKRLGQKNNLEGLINRAMHPVIRLIKHLNPMTKALKELPMGFHSILYFDDRPVSCFWGFLCNDKRIILPRGGVDMSYSKYSPGGIIIIETIKDIIEKHSDLKVEQYDLSRGTEDYKFTYGGVVHLNYHYNI
jgi:hypothetical protein